MVQSVSMDLRVFMLFFLILHFMWSIMFTILDLRQYEYSDDPDVRAILEADSYPG